MLWGLLEESSTILGLGYGLSELKQKCRAIMSAFVEFQNTLYLPFPGLWLARNERMDPHSSPYIAPF